MAKSEKNKCRLQCRTEKVAKAPPREAVAKVLQNRRSCGLQVYPILRRVNSCGSARHTSLTAPWPPTRRTSYRPCLNARISDPLHCDGEPRRATISFLGPPAAPEPGPSVRAPRRPATYPRGGVRAPLGTDTALK